LDTLRGNGVMEQGIEFSRFAEDDVVVLKEGIEEPIRHQHV
jgi:hypothetical protein